MRRAVAAIICIALLMSLCVFAISANAAADGDGVIFNESMTELIQYPAGKTGAYTVPDKVRYICDNAFENCTGLTSIIVSDSVVSIGSGAFRGCTKLSSVTIGSGVTRICSNAFEGCSELTSVVMGSSVTEIDSYAFFGCTKLASVTIGTSVKTVEGKAFGNTAFYNNDANWENGVLYIGNILYEAKSDFSGAYTVKDGTVSISNHAFYGRTGLTSIIIPDSITEIDWCTFAGCTGLTSVTIPESVTSIGIYAFQDCTDLASIKIPDKVTWIGSFAFNNCTKLTSINIPDGVTSLEHGVLADCTVLTEITIPDKVTIIDDFALAGCKGLTSIAIPDSVTEIGRYAFSYCTGLTSITIPDSVTSIGDYVFDECAYLTEINVDKNNKYFNSIDGILFDKANTRLIRYPEGKTSTSFTVPEGVTGIKDFAFGGCTRLTEVKVEEGNNSLKSIDGILFGFDETELILYPAGRKGTAYTIPDTVTSLSASSFNECKNLSSITIPESVTSIVGGVFYGSEALESIYIYNPSCDISEYSRIPQEATVYGCKGSTAEAYAAENRNGFVVISSSGHLRGDVDLSGGEPNIADALMLFKHIAGVNLITNEDALTVADIDGTAGVTIADALTLFKFVAGVISEL